MLRIDRSNTGFAVIPEQDGRYDLYYGFFSLGDDVGSEPAQLYPTKYWDPYECFEQRVDNAECFIYVAEKSEGRVVHSERFFFSASGRKHTLTWSIEKMPWRRRFEENAHEIVLTWKGGAEPVRSEYIYLFRKNDPKDRFQFLTDVIRPAQDKSGEYTEHYVFFPQEGRDGSDYKIGFEPLLLEKYNVSEV